LHGEKVYERVMSRLPRRAAAGRRGCGVGLAVVLTLAAGCSRDARPLAHTYPSPEALAAAVLDGVARRDRPLLHGLALSEREFRDHVWPELPAARPERNLPFSYVWGDLRQKSEASLAQMLAGHGGRRYELVSVGFAGGKSPYRRYTVHRRTVLTVKDDRGVQVDLRLFGSSLEQDGAWKVFSYVVD
jgi:hypothetical protein